PAPAPSPRAGSRGRPRPAALRRVGQERDPLTVALPERPHHAAAAARGSPGESGSRANRATGAALDAVGGGAGAGPDRAGDPLGAPLVGVPDALAGAALPADVHAAPAAA